MPGPGGNSDRRRGGNRTAPRKKQGGICPPGFEGKAACLGGSESRILPNLGSAPRNRGAVRFPRGSLHFQTGAASREAEAR